MAFHFSLEAILHLRKSLEHQQELRLRAANQQVAKARHLLEQSSARIRHLEQLSTQELSAGTTSAEMRFMLETRTLVRQQHLNLESQLAHLLQLRDQQQSIFRQARRARETFENLRNQQFHEYEREETRNRQRRVDELFLIRKAFLKRS